MRILAHRGASGYAPENTFAAFELARKMHADAIETDVRITRDGVLVLMHDEKLDRTTTGLGLVRETTWREMEAIDAGTKFSPNFAGERVPQLAQFLDRFVPLIPVCLEIKLNAVVDPLVKLLSQHNLEGHRNVEFTSFEWSIVEQLRHRLPGATIGFLSRDFTRESVDRVRKLGIAGICPPAKDATCDLVAYAHDAGLTVRTWGAKTRDVLQHILDCGVDGTTLNHPDWIRRDNGSVTVVPESTIRSTAVPGAEL